jgi:hypothetical protein
VGVRVRGRHVLRGLHLCQLSRRVVVIVGASCAVCAVCVVWCGVVWCGAVCGVAVRCGVAARPGLQHQRDEPV